MQPILPSQATASSDTDIGALQVFLDADTRDESGSLRSPAGARREKHGRRGRPRTTARRSERVQSSSPTTGVEGAERFPTTW
jgi:hypothetical protein